MSLENIFYLQRIFRISFSFINPFLHIYIGTFMLFYGIIHYTYYLNIFKSVAALLNCRLTKNMRITSEKICVSISINKKTNTKPLGIKQHIKKITLCIHPFLVSIIFQLVNITDREKANLLCAPRHQKYY